MAGHTLKRDNEREDGRRERGWRQEGYGGCKKLGAMGGSEVERAGEEDGKFTVRVGERKKERRKGIEKEGKKEGVADEKEEKTRMRKQRKGGKKVCAEVNTK